MTKPTDVRKDAYHFYDENKEKGKHFKSKGVSVSTIYRILSRYENAIEASILPRKLVNTKMPPKKT